ncbi:hypothetical protein GAY28_36220 [Azospirillum brasilense]|nr:hypothetical protein [Azospirillum brasilense]
MPLPLDPHLLQLYLVAALVLTLAPGPDSLPVLSRRRVDGRNPGGGRRATRRALRNILADVKRRRGRQWPPRGYQPGQVVHA